MSDQRQSWLSGLVGDPAFLRKYTYFAATLARLHPVADPKVDAMAVAVRQGRLELRVNVDYFAEHPRDAPGVLLHELHHVALGHLSNPKFRGAEHPDLMMLAMEVSANEYIQEPLPGDPATWKALRHLGLRSGQSTMRRYELLVEARSKGNEPPDWQPVDDHHPQGLGQVCPDPLPGDPSARIFISRLLRHSAREGEDRRSQWERAMRLLGGSMPRGLVQQLQQAEGPPPKLLDWNKAVEMFVGVVRVPAATYSRPSRRFPDRIGEIPGRVHCRLRGPAPPVIAAIDTSSSMSPGELARIARQLTPLSRLVEVTIVECDSKIQRIYPFKGEVKSVTGRGGTDLRPVFSPAFLQKHRPDGIIYFTDGEGPYPPEDPGVKTLWVLTKPAPFGCPWGTKALLPDEDHPSS